jgi:hypothetical protein
MCSPPTIVVALANLFVQVFLVRLALDPSLLVASVEQKPSQQHVFFICYEETLIDDDDYRLQ